MKEERFYCSKCMIPAEYILEIDIYSCGQCEGTFVRGELLKESMLEDFVSRAQEVLNNKFKGVHNDISRKRS